MLDVDGVKVPLFVPAPVEDVDGLKCKQHKRGKEIVLLVVAEEDEVEIQQKPQGHADVTDKEELEIVQGARRKSRRDFDAADEIHDQVAVRYRISIGRPPNSSQKFGSSCTLSSTSCSSSPLPAS